MDPDEGAIVSKVRKAKFHPDFNSKTFDNDIALFLLDNPEVYQRHFMPICLPSSNETDHVGETGVVAGWGLLKMSGTATWGSQRGLSGASLGGDSCTPFVKPGYLQLTSKPCFKYVVAKINVK